MELHQMNRGECVVLRGADKNILMVDCGETAFGGVSGLMKRYAGIRSRGFLLTHWHGDGLRALDRILRVNPNYFHRIYLPVSPRDKKGKPLLLEFALFSHVFQKQEEGIFDLSTAVLTLLPVLAAKTGADRLFPLQADGSFCFDKVDYDVLWPAAQAFPFTDLFSSAVENMNVCLSSPFLPEAAREFLRLKERFCAAYADCCRVSPMEQADIDRMAELYGRIGQLAPRLRELPPAQDIAEILGRPTTRTAYAFECRASGVIFHNRRKSEASTDDILMTGAAEPESMDAVSPRLYDGYYILKAPQHGVSRAWSHIFGEISASHILITHGKEPIAGEYVDLPAIRHCTDCAGCPWMQSSGCCCNRLSCCYELSPPGLTIKCPSCRDPEIDRPCGISVISPARAPSCLCDGKPANIN
ncbi:MBL fold metallo-hydrolase [Caproiciproducens sp.]